MYDEQEMKKTELVERAICALQELTGLKISSSALSSGATEGELLIGENGWRVAFEVKSRMPVFAAPSMPLADAPKTTELVVILPYVSLAKAELFRQAGIGFLDMSGNAFLLGPKREVCLIIRGLPPVAVNELTGARAFRPVGIRLMYALMVAPELLQATYRGLQEVLDISLGSIVAIFREWQQRSLLGTTGPARRPHRYWNSAVVQRWVEAYGDQVRPGLARGRYRLPADSNWEELTLPAGSAWWGGEPAASLLLDGYLRPEKFTLYTRLSRMEFVRQLRLIPDPHGPLTVLEAFEPANLPVPRPHPACVYPLLAYADLMLSLDPRNREVAQLLYSKYHLTEAE